MSRITIGSTYFFDGMPGFNPHDTDYIEVLETTEFKKKRVIRGQGMDLFQIANRPLASMLEDDLNSKLPMVLGKWLVPEFCNMVGFGFEDLPKLRPLVDRIDRKHEYERIIYEAYMENGGFTLTEAQRGKAYESYKESRRENE